MYRDVLAEDDSSKVIQEKCHPKGRIPFKGCIGQKQTFRDTSVGDKSYWNLAFILLPLPQGYFFSWFYFPRATWSYRIPVYILHYLFKHISLIDFMLNVFN
jgi:hypothetical protein